ncbi:MAG: AEC family transporter [Thauera phenolivorans]|uniref:AEC family transporter n=1 Tax=Thauera phenolivorans TaxID=1792543 RepID=A0A7X7LVT1_9RHOO|nr:AEC family transporter [Thauera phenolivorans]
MLAILAITGPIFILIAVGFASVRLRVLAATDMRALGVFVINFALPALLFRAVSSGAVSETVRPDLLLPYALGSLAVVALVVALAMTVLRRKLQMAAVLAMGMSVSNSAFIGFPIAQQLSPASASAALAVYALVEALIMFPLLMALAELGGGGGGRWPRVLRGIALSLGKNPMILAILAGLACSLLALQVPLPLARAIELLGSTAAPVALFYIGGTLAGLKVKIAAGDIALIVAGKLLLHPLMVFLAFLALPLDGASLQAAAVLNACMPMMIIYPILAQKYGQEGLCAAALVATTVASFFTISGFLWLSGAGG